MPAQKISVNYTIVKCDVEGKKRFVVDENKEIVLFDNREEVIQFVNSLPHDHAYYVYGQNFPVYERKLGK